ncbi:MAG: LysM peptidoglycan-binding domain-containing protein [Anaerofustis stercorihominis]|nr:LysM peptidoglycan-binding domain-containing protein [Anaerofustis stercorihominis]
MLHIIREGESLSDIAKIYKVNTTKIKNSNLQGCIYASGSCCYIPSDREIFFTENNIQTGELSDILNMSEEELCEANDIPGSVKIPGNVLLYTKKKNYDRSLFSAIYKVNDITSSFVNLDVNAHLVSNVFIDCYNVIDGEINLPCDYPAINACKINGITPSLYIDDVSILAQGDVLLQLLHDLSFKEYSQVLLNIKNEGDLQYISQAINEFHNERMNICITANENILKSIDHEDYSCLYYKSRRNVFDFTSFTEIITSLLTHIPAHKLGYAVQLHAADIDRNNMNINYPSVNDISDMFDEGNGEYISFDEISQLCFFKYTSDGTVRNVIYEDLRSVYAKASYLKKCGIDKFLIAELKNEYRCIFESILDGIK